MDSKGGVAACEEDLERCAKLKIELKNLREKLEDLPKRLTHEVLVPFGNVAFMPGYLKHTNEMLVLLGDGWFASKTVPQAKEVLERRLEHVAKTERDLKTKLRTLQESVELAEHDSAPETSNRNLFLEIREDLEGNPLPGAPQVSDSAALLKKTPALQERLKKLHLDSEQASVESKPQISVVDPKIQAWLDELEAEEEAILSGGKSSGRPGKSVSFSESVHEIEQSRTVQKSVNTPADIYDLSSIKSQPNAKPITSEVVERNYGRQRVAQPSADTIDQQIAMKELATAYHRKQTQRQLEKDARKAVSRSDDDETEPFHLDMGSADSANATLSAPIKPQMKISKFKASLMSNR